MGSISPADLMIPISDTGGSPKEGREEKHMSNSSVPIPGEMSVEKKKARNDLKGRDGRCVGRLRFIDTALRSAVVAFMVVSLSAMFTSTQHSQVSIFGLTFPVSMSWNRSQPFEFLVVVELIVCAYAFLQFVGQSVLLVKKSSLMRKHMLMQLVADQACTYLVLAAAAAAAGASRTNKVAFQSLRVQNINVPGVCTILDKFCNRATIAIIFTLLAAFASAISAGLDVYLLTLTF